MGYIRLELKGSDVADRMLARVENVPGLAREALQAGADVLLPVEQAHAPVLHPGGPHIKSRLAIKIKGGGSKMTAHVGVWDEPIAYYVERGHGGPHPAPAHPYMEPAAEEAEDAVLDAITQTIADQLGL